MTERRSGSSRTPEPRATQPPPEFERGRHSDIMLTEIAKLQADAEGVRRELNELRTDMRDVRDRLTRVEVRLDHLPSKEFIVSVVTIALAIIGALVTLAPKLQSFLGVTH